MIFFYYTQHTNNNFYFEWTRLLLRGIDLERRSGSVRERKTNEVLFVIDIRVDSWVDKWASANWSWLQFCRFCLLRVNICMGKQSTRRYNLISIRVPIERRVHCSVLMLYIWIFSSITDNDLTFCTRDKWKINHSPPILYSQLHREFFLAAKYLYKAKNRLRIVLSLIYIHINKLRLNFCFSFSEPTRQMNQIFHGKIDIDYWLHRLAKRKTQYKMNLLDLSVHLFVSFWIQLVSIYIILIYHKQFIILNHR